MPTSHGAASGAGAPPLRPWMLRSSTRAAEATNSVA